VTFPSLLDAALACAFLAGMFGGWVVRWFYAERSR
jgi:hypothetical protein